MEATSSRLFISQMEKLRPRERFCGASGPGPAPGARPSPRCPVASLPGSPSASLSSHKPGPQAVADGKVLRGQMGRLPVASAQVGRLVPDQLVAPGGGSGLSARASVASVSVAPRLLRAGAEQSPNGRCHPGDPGAATQKSLQVFPPENSMEGVDDTREVRAEQPRRGRDSRRLATAGSCYRPQGRAQWRRRYQSLGAGAGARIGEGLPPGGGGWPGTSLCWRQHRAHREGVRGEYLGFSHLFLCSASYWSDQPRSQVAKESGKCSSCDMEPSRRKARMGPGITGQ